MNQSLLRHGVFIAPLIAIAGLIALEHMAHTTPASHESVQWPTEQSTYQYVFELENSDPFPVYMNLSVSLHCIAEHRNAPIAFRDIVVQVQPFETKQHRETFTIPKGSWVSVAHHRLNTVEPVHHDPVDMVARSETGAR